VPLEAALAIGRGEGDAQGHRLLVDDVGEARLTGRMAQGANDETLPKKRMSRIGHLDGVGLWVLDVGIKAGLLSIGSAMTGC
jgi:hypothetical protein